MSKRTSKHSKGKVTQNQPVYPHPRNRAHPYSMEPAWALRRWDSRCRDSRRPKATTENSKTKHLPSQPFRPPPVGNPSLLPEAAH